MKYLKKQKKQSKVVQLMSSPLLTDADLMDPAVIKILKYFENRLTKLREDNDSFTAHESTKGRIAEIKAFNRAIKPKQPKETNIIRSVM